MISLLIFLKHHNDTCLVDQVQPYLVQVSSDCIELPGLCMFKEHAHSMKVQGNHCRKFKAITVRILVGGGRLSLPC